MRQLLTYWPRKFVTRWLKNLNPLERRKARAFLKFWAALSLCFPLYAIAYFAAGLIHLGWAVLSFGLLVAASPLASFLSGRLSPSTHLLCGITTFCLCIVSYSTGGIESPALYWFTILPATGMFLMGQQGAFLWGGMALVACSVQLVLSQFIPLQLLGPKALQIIHFLSVTGLVAVAVILVSLENKDSEYRIAKEKGHNKSLLQAERAASAALIERDQAQMARVRFLQIVGHELRTPLNGLLHLGPEISGKTAPNELAKTAETILASVRRLDDAIEALVLHAKLSGGDGVDIPLRFTGLELVTGICVELAEAERVHIVSAEPPDRTWLGDRDAARFAVKALLVNALRYSEGEVEVWVRGGEACQIDILDWGTGLNTGMLDDTTVLASGARKRQGLGLPVARQAVQALDGTMELLPRDGGGTHARLRFYLEAGTPEESQGHGLRNRTVLVVDDDRTNRLVLKRLLKRLDCEVLEAENGAIAVEIGLEKKPGLILMDCEMPVMDGWEATRVLRNQLGPELPIVAVTAYVANADRLRCLEAGMNDVLAKPLRRKLFEATLSRWLKPSA